MHVLLSDSVFARQTLDVPCLLESSPELTQLGLRIPFTNNVLLMLRSACSSRLLQLSIHSVGGDALSMLKAACPNLRRLELHQCNLGDVDLTSALTSSLRVLTLADCSNPLALAFSQQIRS